jgi:riboflavin-specific deaminase-like protein
MTSVLDDLDRAAGAARGRDRPFVTLAYAQSVDGSIARKRGEPFRLSGEETSRMTHAIRGWHDAILVGVGTVLSDDPELSVRLADGRDPQPIIVDSQLRTPPSSRLLARRDHPVWIATATNGEAQAGFPDSATGSVSTRQLRAVTLESKGARILNGPPLSNGWVDLNALLRTLKAEGIDRLMVEGGAHIITSFLAARLVDFGVVTVAPVFLGGLSAVQSRENATGKSTPLDDAVLPRFDAWATHQFGNDLVLTGTIRWKTH